MKKIFFLLLLVALRAVEFSSASPAVSSSLQFDVFGHKIFQSGQPIHFRGVLYSPAPAGSSPLWTIPHGDFFTSAYGDLWARDFPLIKQLGANTIRVSGWNFDSDHSEFLNLAHAHGFFVFVDFSFDLQKFPLAEEWQRQNLLGTFKWQVSKHLKHPAIAAWGFGSEINGNWKGFLRALGDSWNCQYSDVCYGNSLASWCEAPVACAYRALMQFINQAAVYAKDLMGSQRPHLIYSSFSDVDSLTERLAKFEQFAPEVDAWGMQIYRGSDFGTGEGDFLAQFKRASKKPLLITEFGVDAYRDPCGTSETSPCFNTHENERPGFGEDEETQAEWIVKLAKILTGNSSATGEGPVAGEIVYEWSDEWWKASVNVRGCYGPIPYGKPGFEPGQCDYKAHADCPFKDLWWQSLCGFPTIAQPDGYANQAWFGLVKIWPQPGYVDKVFPRAAYRALQSHWAGSSPPYWMILSIACLTVSLAIAGWILAKWRARTREFHGKIDETSALLGKPAALQ